MVNIYIAYKMNLGLLNVGKEFAWGNFLFGAVKLTNNADFDKCKYSGYGIGFGIRESFSLSDDSRIGKNVITFSVDHSSLVHIDNKKKDILILWKGPTDGLDDTTLTKE